MTGIHADWFTDPQRLRVVVVGTLALALAIRLFASFLVRQLLHINRKKRRIRYRIPLALAHPRRGKAIGIASSDPDQLTGRRTAAAMRRSKP